MTYDLNYANLYHCPIRYQCILRNNNYIVAYINVFAVKAFQVVFIYDLDVIVIPTNKPLQ